MNSFMKKRILLFILLIIIAIQSGCSLVSNDSVMKARKSSNDVLAFLESKDTDKLRSLFCDKIHADYLELDEDIETAMMFFQGNILSHDNPLYNESESIRNGEYVKYSVSPSIHEIKTDAGKTYHIIYYYTVVNTDYPESVGISEIMIKDENGETCKIGDYHLVNPE